MFTRCTFFLGTLPPEREAAFEAFVEERLLPLWRRYPHAQAVRVVRPTAWREGATPDVILLLEIDYPSLDAIREALASPIRAEAREVTFELMRIVEAGRIFHIVCRPLPEQAAG